MTRCNQCEACAACKTAMGGFWRDRSNGGEGCDNPFTAQQVATITSRRATQTSAAAHDATPPRVQTPVPWTVYHLGAAHETLAVSERDAVNKVRFRLYGTKPGTSCAPFAAERGQTQTAAKATARLAAFLRRAV